MELRDYDSAGGERHAHRKEGQDAADIPEGHACGGTHTPVSNRIEGGRVDEGEEARKSRKYRAQRHTCEDERSGVNGTSACRPLEVDEHGGGSRVEEREPDVAGDTAEPEEPHAESDGEARTRIDVENAGVGQGCG